MRRKSSLEATAYHEAGHAVVNCHLKIALRREGVTIVPDKVAGTGGTSSHRKTISSTIEYDASDRNRIRAERYVQGLIAGEMAQRRYNPRSVRNEHGSSDRHEAIKVLSYFANNENELGPWFKLLRIRTENLLAVPDVWQAVERLAAALMERRTIPGKEATEIIYEGYKEHLDLQHPELREVGQELSTNLKSAPTLPSARRLKALLMAP